MGKQVLLHMTASDRSELCTYAQGELGLQFGRRDGGTKFVPLLRCSSINNDGTFCIWSKHLCPDLMRSWIPDPGYYRVDTLRLPVIEYLPSVETEWEGKPALCQGRIFGNFEINFGKPDQFLDSYNAIVKWVKGRYKKNPFGLGGYIGPSAWDFYSNGGYLLPSFVPPNTTDWKNSLSAQHSH